MARELAVLGELIIYVPLQDYTELTFSLRVGLAGLDFHFRIEAVFTPHLVVFI
jgi:hypothetical protein